MSFQDSWLLLDSPSFFVDDSDPTIQYIGDWNAPDLSDGRFIDFSETGPMLASLHVLQIFNGSFSYNFTGVGISVHAAIITSNGYTTSCLVDGNQIPPASNTTDLPFGQNPPLCQVVGLTNSTTHTIFVSVSVIPPTADQQFQNPDLRPFGFAFDYFLVQPEVGIGATQWDDVNQDVYLPFRDMIAGVGPTPSSVFSMVFMDTDLHIANVSSTWQPDNSGMKTLTLGSQFNMSFTGTRLWWYGYHNSTTDALGWATFYIDNGKPASFNVFGDSKSETYLFSTPILQYGTHFLTVVHNGTNGTSSLSVQSVVIEKFKQGTVVSTSSGTFSSSTPTTLPQIPINTSPPSTERRNVSSIAGGIAGGVAFVLLVFGLCVFFWWRRRQGKSTHNPRSTTAIPEPFLAPSQVTVQLVGPQKARASQQNSDPPNVQLVPEPSVPRRSRRHTIPVSPSCVPTSSAPTQHEGQPLASPINHLNTPNGLQSGSTDTDTTSRKPVAQPRNALQATTQGSLNATALPGAEGEREEDSGLRMMFVPILPPLYTTV